MIMISSLLGNKFFFRYLKRCNFSNKILLFFDSTFSSKNEIYKLRIISSKIWKFIY